MGSTLGIIPARVGSDRLKDKCIRKIGGFSLIDIAARKFNNIDLEYTISTNYGVCKGPRVMRRPAHLDSPDISVLEVYKYVLEKKGKTDGICVVLFPTNPLITQEFIYDSIDMVSSGEFEVVRSYDSKGRENGLYTFNVEYFLDNPYKIDVKTGAIFAPGFEIHTLADYTVIRESMEAPVIEEGQRIYEWRTTATRDLSKS